MPLDVLSRQVLISGRVTDAISNTRTRKPATIGVLDDSTSQPLASLLVRVSPNGYYAVYGDPVTMPVGQDISVRLQINAVGYQATQAVVAFTAAQLVRIVESITIGTESVDVGLIDNVPRVEDVQLEPVPVVLKGLVVADEDPSVAIVGAVVEVTAPSPLGSVSTDADGYFTLGGGIPPLPVGDVITLRIEAPAHQTLTTDFRLDFRKPFNQGSFALTSV